jgi:hypothetical protein
MLHKWKEQRLQIPLGHFKETTYQNGSGIFFMFKEKEWYHFRTWYLADVCVRIL